MEKDKYLGKRLEGRYEIERLIGMGGMANVYRAYDVIDERPVAVKILRDEYLGNAEFLRRFRNESKAIAVLSHPNIVRVFDVSFTGRVPSIVMEYIDGITLKDYMEQLGGKLGWKEAVHFTLQILRALQHAHDKGIVHRDIKPQNIMLIQNGEIKVTDFGIARFARSEVRTITDRAIGSVHYISPEQAMGENTDEKSDIYSVGVMLFEMLTGKLPFEADSPVSVAIKQIQTQAARPTTINPDIPTGLEDITVRAMQKDAARRYQSAAEMIADIERFKLDPSIHFQYKYLESEEQSAKSRKYSRAITQTRRQEAREEEPMQKTRKKRTPYIPVLTGVTFAFVLASAGFIGLMLYLNNPFTRVPEVEMPNLVGVKFDTAKNQHDGIEVIMQAQPEPNNEYGKDVIFEQSVKPGKMVKEGSSVEVKVSSGQIRMTLENFASRDIIEVESKLTEMGLNCEKISMYSDEVPIGSVIYTEPSKDSEVRPGQTVTVYVSRGPEEIPAVVPDLINMTVDDATRYLELSSLRIGQITYEENNDVPPDTIISQIPPPGSNEKEGAEIDIVVSKGNEPDYKTLQITVPMPSINRPVRIYATMDGDVVQEESDVVPAEIENWKPHFRGVDETVNIRVYIDNRLYRAYELDFDTKKFRITEDNSFEF